MKIFAITQNSGVSKWRLHWPLDYLADKHKDVTVTYAQDIKDISVLDGYDILMFNRYLASNSNLIDYCKAHNIKVVMDIDDYWILPYHHMLKELYEGMQMPKWIEYNIKNADLITTTTEYFKSVISKYTSSPIVVIPNVINPTLPQFNREGNNVIYTDRIRIGLLGSINHEKDIELLQGVYNSLSPSTKEKCQFVLCGFSIGGKMRMFMPDGSVKERDRLPEESEWNRMEKIFSSNYYGCSEKYKEFLSQYIDANPPMFKDEPYKRYWGRDIDSYAYLYDNIDVLLVPLVNDQFNNCKSELKCVEGGWFRKTLIVSNTESYSMFDNIYQKGGLINETGHLFKVSKPSEWKKFIELIVNHPQLLLLAGQNLNEKIRLDYDIDTYTEKRYSTYANLITK